jgi:hypothetical protein
MSFFRFLCAVISLTVHSQKLRGKRASIHPSAVSNRAVSNSAVSKLPMSLFGGTNPSPERDPRLHPTTPRAKVLIHDTVPMAFERSISSRDEMQEMLDLCGITPPDETIDYLWETLKAGRLVDLDLFKQSMGALGLNLELCISSRQELEWFPTEYQDTRSVVLSTKHREGSELGALRNLNEGHPGLDDIRVELLPSRTHDHAIQCKVSWDYDVISSDAGGVKWDLIRSIYNQLHNQDLPTSLSVAPGQSPSFHYITLELDPFTVQVQPTNEQPSKPAETDSAKASASKATKELQRFDLSLKNPPIETLLKILAISNSPQLNSVFVRPTSRHDILDHMIRCLRTNQRLDVDVLRACDEASPCLVFVREKISDGESFPPTITSKAILRDYTSSPGEFHLELESVGEEVGSEPGEGEESDADIVVHLTWRRGHPVLGTHAVEEIRAVARSFITDERYRE